jgi:hypothetical protein
MAPILAPILGVQFLGEHTLKMGPFAPFSATIQALSSTRGRFVWTAPSLSLARTYFIIDLNMWFVSWESTPARVKLAKEVQNIVTRAEIIECIHTQNMTYCIRINVTVSNVQVGLPEFYGGTAGGSIQTCVAKHYFVRALLHPSSVC